MARDFLIAKLKNFNVEEMFANLLADCHTEKLETLIQKISKYISFKTDMKINESIIVWYCQQANQFKMGEKPKDIEGKESFCDLFKQALERS